MRSTIHVQADQLVHIVGLLDMVGIEVVGSADGNGVVVLVVQGDIVPDAEQVRIEVVKTIGQIYAQIIARCEVVE